MAEMVDLFAGELAVPRAPRELKKLGARHIQLLDFLLGVKHAFLYGQSLLDFGKRPIYPEVHILGRKRRMKRVRSMSYDFSPSEYENVGVGGVKVRESESPAHLLGSGGDRSP